jgi:hypothetical protein
LFVPSAIVAVALNPVARKIPLQRGWTAAGVAVLTFGSLAFLVWLGARILIDQVRGLSERIPDLEEQLTEWEAALQKYEEWDADAEAAARYFLDLLQRTDGPALRAEAAASAEGGIRFRLEARESAAVDEALAQTWRALGSCSACRRSGGNDMRKFLMLLAPGSTTTRAATRARPARSTASRT